MFKDNWRENLVLVLPDHLLTLLMIVPNINVFDRVTEAILYFDRYSLSLYMVFCFVFALYIAQ